MAKDKPTFKITLNQPVVTRPPFDAYNKDVAKQVALGSERNTKILEVGYIQSTNWKQGASGWRLGPLGIEFGNTDGTFPPGVISLASLQEIADATLLGNATGGDGPVAQITMGAGMDLSGGVLSSTITQYDDQMAQDAIGAIVGNTDTAFITYDGTGHTLTVDVNYQMSITSDSSGLMLDGDSASPGNNQFYGTNAGGTKGFYGLPGTYQFAAYAAGTAYSLTNTYAKLDFGTTDPAITITTPGTYMLMARARIDYTGATFVANRIVSLKIRRTNNTAADVANSTASFAVDIVTTFTGTAMVLSLPPVIYTTTNSNDALEVEGKVDTVPSAGSIDAVEAEIVAIRIA